VKKDASAVIPAVAVLIVTSTPCFAAIAIISSFETARFFGSVTSSMVRPCRSLPVRYQGPQPRVDAVVDLALAVPRNRNEAAAARRRASGRAAQGRRSR
jgi:hypothetical protein